MKNRVPIGTQTYIFKTGKLDVNGKLDRANIVTKELPRNITDHVSYDPPQSNMENQYEYDLMMTKPRYAKNHQSQNPLIPFDMKHDN